MQAGQGFSVCPDAVHRLGDLVFRAGDGADDYGSQFDRIVGDGAGGDTSEGEGFLATIWPKLDEWQREGQRQTRLAWSLGERAGTELRCVAEWYATRDAGIAAQFDRIHREPDAERVPASQVRDPAVAGSFRDVVPVSYDGPDPSEVANPSWWPVKAEMEAEKALGLGGALGTVAELFRLLAGDDEDIITRLGEVLAGDWSILQRQAVLYADAATGFAAIAANINQGRFGIQQEWTGESADQAKNWLAGYHAGCVRLSEYLHDAGSAIQGLAESAYHLMQDIRHGLAAAIDILLLVFSEGAVLAIKEGTTLVTVISTILTHVGRGESIYKILKDGDWLALVHLVWSFLEEVGQVQLAVDTLLGLAHQFAAAPGAGTAIAGTINAGDPPRWPEPYEHPDAECTGSSGRNALPLRVRQA